eukprot:scaffold123937_cov69-Phaeocystis_antarctica.AAC.1
MSRRAHPWDAGPQVWGGGVNEYPYTHQSKYFSSSACPTRGTSGHETRYTHALLGVQTVACREATTPQMQGACPWPAPRSVAAPVEPPPCQ